MPKTKTDQALIECAQLARTRRIEVLCRMSEGIIHRLPVSRKNRADKRRITHTEVVHDEIQTAVS
jgi:hypothetical protein